MERWRCVLVILLGGKLVTFEVIKIIEEFIIETVLVRFCFPPGESSETVASSMLFKKVSAFFKYHMEIPMSSFKIPINSFKQCYSLLKFFLKSLTLYLFM